MAFDYRGIFINLDRSTERRAHIEEQLEKLNLRDRYSRFPAIDAEQFADRARPIRREEEACFRSHYEALTLARQFGCPVHIIEDDTVFAQQFEAIVWMASGLFSQYDIVFTDTFVTWDPSLLRQLKDMFDRCVGKAAGDRTFMVSDVRSWYRALMASYFVMPNAIETVHCAFARGLAAGPRKPIDIFIREEAQAGRLRLGCIFPFITTPYHLDGSMPTTIPNREPNSAVSRAVIAMLSYSFFIDRDMSKFPIALTGKLWSTPDEHARLMAGVLNFVVSSPEFAPH